VDRVDYTMRTRGRTTLVKGWGKRHARDRLGDGGRVAMSGRFDAAQADKADLSCPASVVGGRGFPRSQTFPASGWGSSCARKRLSATGATLRLVRVNRHIERSFVFPVSTEYFLSRMKHPIPQDERLAVANLSSAGVYV
jgi:hypothetical protein